MVVIGSCSNKQTIVGTWTDIEGYNWVFSADGKLLYDDDEYKYSVFDGERGTVLTIFEAGGSFSDFKDQAYNVDYSRDGRTIRLAGGSNFYGWSVAGPGWGTNELVRQTDSSSQSNSESNPLFSTTDRNLNGTWVDDNTSRGVVERRFNDGQFEFYQGGYLWVKGTYTASRGKLTISVDGEEDTVDYSINGNKLIITFDGGTTTSTKKSP